MSSQPASAGGHVSTRAIKSAESVIALHLIKLTDRTPPLTGVVVMRVASCDREHDFAANVLALAQPVRLRRLSQLHDGHLRRLDEAGLDQPGDLTELPAVRLHE